MNTRRHAHFNASGGLRTLEHWALYAAFAEPPGALGLVKIGISQSVLRRIHDVHCGSPFPIKAALWSHVGSKAQALSAEKTIKRRLADRRTRGEWFSFDFASAEDKERFHAVLRVAFMRATGRPLTWNRTDIESIKDALGLNWEDFDRAS